MCNSSSNGATAKAANGMKVLQALATYHDIYTSLIALAVRCLAQRPPRKADAAFAVSCQGEWTELSGDSGVGK